MRQIIENGINVYPDSVYTRSTGKTDGIIYKNDSRLRLVNIYALYTTGVGEVSQAHFYVGPVSPPDNPVINDFLHTMRSTSLFIVPPNYYYILEFAYVTTAPIIYIWSELDV